MVKYSAEKFKIRGYKNVFGAKVFTCESDEASVADENNRANMENQMITNYRSLFLRIMLKIYL